MGSYANVAVRNAQGDIIGYQSTTTGQFSPGIGGIHYTEQVVPTPYLSNKPAGYQGTNIVIGQDNTYARALATHAAQNPQQVTERNPYAPDTAAAIVWETRHYAGARAAPVSEDLAKTAIKEGYTGTIRVESGRSTVPIPEPVSPLSERISSAASGNYTTVFMPIGSGSVAAIGDSKLVISAAGELGVYQKQYYYGQLRRELGLIGGGGRNALQSGSFSIKESMAPESRTYKQWEIGSIQPLPSGYANKFSRLGAEAYGGIAGLSLDNRTIESTGAKLSTYANPNNLARYVAPEAVNLGKAELPGATFPWGISQASPTIQFANQYGIIKGSGINVVSGAVTSKPITVPLPLTPLSPAQAALPAPFISKVNGKNAMLIPGVMGLTAAMQIAGPDREATSLPSPFISTLEPTPVIASVKPTSPTGRVQIADNLYGDLSTLKLTMIGSGGIPIVPGSIEVKETVISKSEPSLQNIALNFGGNVFNEFGGLISGATAGYVKIPAAKTTYGFAEKQIDITYQQTVPAPYTSRATTGYKGADITLTTTESTRSIEPSVADKLNQQIGGAILPPLSPEDIIYPTSKNADLLRSVYIGAYSTVREKPLDVVKAAAEGVLLARAFEVAGVSIGAGISTLTAGTRIEPVLSTLVRYRVPQILIVAPVAVGVTREITSDFTDLSATAAERAGEIGVPLVAMAAGAGLYGSNPSISDVSLYSQRVTAEIRPDIQMPSGAALRVTNVESLAPRGLTLTAFGRDISLPRALRQPEITTAETSYNDAAIMAARLGEASINPLSNVREVMARTETPVFQDISRTTGEVRIAETRLPRTVNEYVQMGREDARAFGASQEEATAAIMSDAARVMEPVTGYRTLDIYSFEGTPIRDVLRSNFNQATGTNVELTRLNDWDAFTRTLDVTRTGAAEYGIRIERDVTESGFLRGGTTDVRSPESRVIARLQDVSRGFRSGQVEEAFAFDIRGNIIARDVGTPGSVRAIQSQSALAREPGVFAHSHPPYTIREQLDILLDIPLSERPEFISNIIRGRGDVSNLPSPQDIAILSGNPETVLAEYIATPRGVLRYVPESQGMGWRGGSMETFIGKNAPFTSESYIGRIGDVSREMSLARPEGFAADYMDVVDRLVLNNPLLEFERTPPRSEVPLSQSGSNLGRSKPYAALIASQAEMVSREIKPPAPVSGRETVRATLPTAGLTPEAMRGRSEGGIPVVGIISLVGQGTSLSAVSLLKSETSPMVGQTVNIDRISAYIMGSDFGKVSDEQQKDLIKALSIPSSAPVSSEDISFKTIFGSVPILDEISGITQTPRQTPVPRSEYLPDTLPTTTDIPKITYPPYVPIPVIPILPSGASGGGGVSGIKRRYRKFEETFYVGPRNYVNANAVPKFYRTVGKGRIAEVSAPAGSANIVRYQWQDWNNIFNLKVRRQAKTS